MVASNQHQQSLASDGYLMPSKIAERPSVPDNVTTRERCQMCHRYSPLGFWVPDDVWRAAVHVHWQFGPLCIMCFAEGADERGIAWDREIEFYPVSYRTLREDERSPMERGTVGPGERYGNRTES